MKKFNAILFCFLLLTLFSCSEKSKLENTKWKFETQVGERNISLTTKMDFAFSDDGTFVGNLSIEAIPTNPAVTTFTGRWKLTGNFLSLTVDKGGILAGMVKLHGNKLTFTNEFFEEFESLFGAKEVTFTKVKE